MANHHPQLSHWLSQRRQERKRAAALRGGHPLSHVEPDKCYEWMRAECAAHDAARQAREDGLISTITQISSAAILAVPGVIFSSDRKFPALDQSPWLYVGIAAFLLALIIAMIEQYLSAKAYRQQSEIVKAYYTFASDERSDSVVVAWVRRSRNLACIAFATAVIITSAALMTIKGQENGKSASTSPSATSASASATSATSSAKSAQ